MASSESVTDTTNTNTDPTSQAPVIIDTENPTNRSEEKKIISTRGRA